MIKIVSNKETKVRALLVKEIKEIEELELLSNLEVFKGNASEVLLNLNLKNEGLAYVGILNDDNDLLNIRMSGYNLGNKLNAQKINEVSIDTNLLNDEELEAFIEGLVDSLYVYNYYKVKPIKKTLETLSLLNEKRLDLILKTINIMKGVFEARDLVNKTAIDLYPKTYANYVEELFKGSSIEVEVFDKKGIEDLGMEALLAVAKGSDKDPRFIVLRYLPLKIRDHITIVGKGVTYDSGGYALKPAGGMLTMKSDMAGSAAVVGLFKALDLNKPKTNVVGVMALTENLIDGSAYKNGDVIKTMKGTTVEVINTDAEGRLTLADAIYYAATKLDSKEIVETSTLTGACINALGQNITGITTKEDDMYNKIHEIGLKTGELNWRMPMTKDLRASVKSDIAELKNAVAGGGGMMTAGIFLEHFSENIPFMHLDIAGTSYGNGYKHLPKGASGVLVKTFYKYINS